MNAKAMDLHGKALQDFSAGDPSVKIIVHRDDGYVSDLPVHVFFRQPVDFSQLEQTAINFCRGDILDIGAGAGCHSLALQGRGMSVLAVDVSTYAVDVMAKRGVNHVRCVDIFEFTDVRFDTLLMMMHGIGLVGNLAGLDRFLRHAHKLLKPDGQLICDSLDVRHTDDPRHLAYQEANRQAGRYFGEIRMQFEYKMRVGPVFSWLHVAPETLVEHARMAGWSCRVVCQEDDGNYLAQLTPGTDQHSHPEGFQHE